MSRLQSFRTALKSPSERVKTLRNVVSTIQTNQRLDTLPDTFSHILAEYDAARLDPTLREDVHELLAGSAELAHFLLDTAFDSDEAVRLIAKQQFIMSRVLNHISQRPHQTGFTILTPTTGSMIGQFTTEGEAEKQLEALRTIGLASGSIVVPVKLVSQFALRPSVVTPEPSLGEFDELPSALRPDSSDAFNPQTPELLPQETVKP